MAKLRLGIIGCGWIAPFHVQALNQLTDRVEVIWTADPALDRAERIASQLTADRPVAALADYRDVLAQVDAVAILVPHHLHFPITMEALRAGRHVLLEKPFALTLDEADAMIAEADRQARVLMIAYPHRYRKSAQAFKALIDSGKYGRLFMLDAMMDESQQAYISGWLAHKATLGGGVFFSASPHMLDVMLWIAGDVQSVSMVGTHGGLAMEGEDTAISILKFKNGVVGTTRHTWCSPRKDHWYTMRAYCERAVVTMLIDPLGDLATEGHRCPWRSQITVAGSENRTLLDTPEGLDLTEEVRHFLDCVQTGIPCQTDGRVGWAMMAVVLDAYRKAEAEGAN